MLSGSQVLWKAMDLTQMTNLAQAADELLCDQGIIYPPELPR